MDTTYYNLKVRKVKVSGGADLLTLVPAPASASAPAGQVLDFDLCRRRLETRRAWKELTETAQAPAQEAEPEPAQCLPPPARARHERAALWLEMGASAAVILVSLAAVAAFCGLF